VAHDIDYLPIHFRPHREHIGWPTLTGVPQ